MDIIVDTDVAVPPKSGKLRPRKLEIMPGTDEIATLLADWDMPELTIPLEYKEMWISGDPQWALWDLIHIGMAVVAKELANLPSSELTPVELRARKRAFEAIMKWFGREDRISDLDE